MPFGDWWTNWGSTSSGAQTAAGNEFLQTGNVGTPIGGTTCRGSNECASGYACIDGNCTLIASPSSEDGSTSGCGGSGGGGGGCFDGSTGCTTPSCGNGEGGDCCGPRYCRYDQNGNVSCGCGEAPSGACTVFCDSYLASFGAGAAGCEGKVCDECATCDGNYFSSTYNTCIPQTGGPCHCDPSSLPECYKCNDQGTTELDLNCKQCVQVYNVECSCGKIINNVCCYTLEDLKGRYGGDPVTRCQDETAAKCAQACEGEPPAKDPCEGECTEQKIGPLPGSCQDVTDQISVADGHRVVGTGCIEAGGQATVLYNDCDVTNVPESCKQCDCNCNDDCPNCQLCGADGKCYPDPVCSTIYFYSVAWHIYARVTAWGGFGTTGCPVSITELTGQLPTLYSASGVVGQDDESVYWDLSPKYPITPGGACEEQASEAYTQTGQAVLGGNAYSSIIISRVSFNYGYVWEQWDYGAGTGYGSTVQEACLAAATLLPPGISINC